LLRELADDLLAFRFGDIERERFLAAVGAHEIRGVAGVLAVAVLHKGRAPGAGVVTLAGTFDLDYFGAEVGEQLPHPRAGEYAAHVEYADALERAAFCRGFCTHDFRILISRLMALVPPPQVGA
jgi:hypothetical protein